MTKYFLLAATALVALGMSVPASAQTITLTEDGLPNGYELVLLNTPGWNGAVDTGSGKASDTTSVGYVGQQELTVTADSSGATVPYNLYVWCVDFGHEIGIGSTGNVYTEGQFQTTPPALGVDSAPPVTFTQTMLNELNWLANYGNTQLAAHGANADLSAAVQIAMWQTEYGFTYKSGGDANLATEIASLFTLYTTSPGTSPVTNTPIVLLSASGSQELSTLVPPPTGHTNAPEPASLAVLGVALSGLGLARRRRRA